MKLYLQMPFPCVIITYVNENRDWLEKGGFTMQKNRRIQSKIKNMVTKGKAALTEYGYPEYSLWID